MRFGVIPEKFGEITYNTCIYGCTLQCDDMGKERKKDKSSGVDDCRIRLEMNVWNVAM